jgi:hypothetical protein
MPHFCSSSSRWDSLDYLHPSDTTSVL